MQQRALTIRLIRLAMGAAVVLPTLLFAYGSWTAHRSLHVLADERLLRSLDVLKEGASKSFELTNITVSNASDLVAGMSGSDILAAGERLHQQFKKHSDSVEVIQSIWIFGSDGKALVSSSVHPPPPQNFADRDFFQAHLTESLPVYYGQVYPSSLNGEPYFTVSKRLSREGEFVGVLEVSVLPSNFFKFFEALAYTRGLQYALIRQDGLFLARYPEVPAGSPPQLGPQTGFRRMVERFPTGGYYNSTSPVDGVDRRYAIRRLEGTPLYLTAGIENATIRNEWLRTMASHLVFGVPATLLLLVTLFAVLQRSQALYSEIDRRAAAEDALRQSQKLEAIGQLTGGLAHDFNNLLTIIIGNLEGLQRQLSTADAKIKRRADNAMHGAQRAATLTKRLLAFSRQQPLTPTPIDVNKLMSGLSDFLQRALGGRHIARSRGWRRALAG